MHLINRNVVKFIVFFVYGFIIYCALYVCVSVCVCLYICVWVCVCLFLCLCSYFCAWACGVRVWHWASSFITLYLYSHTGAGDPISAPYACVTGSLPTEPCHLSKHLRSYFYKFAASEVIAVYIILLPFPVCGIALPCKIPISSLCKWEIDSPVRLARQMTVPAPFTEGSSC